MKEGTFSDCKGETYWHFTRCSVSLSLLSKKVRQRLQPLFANSKAHSFLANRPANLFRQCSTFSSLISYDDIRCWGGHDIHSITTTKASAFQTATKGLKTGHKNYQVDAPGETQNRSNACDMSHTVAHASNGPPSPSAVSKSACSRIAWSRLDICTIKFIAHTHNNAYNLKKTVPTNRCDRCNRCI